MRCAARRLSNHPDDLRRHRIGGSRSIPRKLAVVRHDCETPLDQAHRIAAERKIILVDY